MPVTPASMSQRTAEAFDAAPAIALSELAGNEPPPSLAVTT